MKVLNGTELAGYIKQRQAKQVRHLRQSLQMVPRLAIVKTSHDEVIETYVRMKQRYGDDIAIDVAVYHVANEELLATIEQLNDDDATHATIIQLPLDDPAMTNEAVNLVRSSKDVDGLSSQTTFTPATAMAIDWLLHGYNIELQGRKVAVVGNGRLVGGPLVNIWKKAGIQPDVFDENSKNMTKQLRRYDVIVTAAGVPGLISSPSIKPGAVVVDAATSSEHGKIIGDIAEDVRARTDLTITPEKGGVGPLTVCALFDNVILAAQAAAKPVS